MAPAEHDLADPSYADTCHPSHVPPADATPTNDPPALIARRPAILDDGDSLPEFPSSSSETFVVRSLSRSALRMLWHQRLRHLNFRRLSEMHRFVKGMPEFKIPTELEGCPICLAAKLH